MTSSYSNEISNINDKKKKNSDFIDGLNLIGKKMKEKFGSEIILTNNVIKSILTVIKSLQNREILLKGATTKITSSYQKLLVPLMAAGLLLLKSVLISLPKSVLIPLGLSAERSAADAAIQKKKKNYESGTTSPIIPNKEMEDIQKIVKSFEESELLIKGISKKY